MASSASLLRSDRSKPHLCHLLFNLCFCRAMGGGPRTFPGGLNKWQYKRMHEKMARDKERRLLQTEKQLYLARLRSEIRAKVSPSHNCLDEPAYASGSAPMSSVEHIKALADRFMKTGAEDLWNESDGPIRSPTVRSIRKAPRIDDHQSKDRINRSKSACGSFNQHRQYSVVARRSPFSTPKYNQRLNSSSDDEDERSNFRLPRFEMRDEVSEEEDGVREGWVSRRKMFSRAALRDYDRKMTRRSPKPVEEEGDRDLLDQFRGIREELRGKVTLRSDVEKHIEEESILTAKRFHDCNVSPLTIKALQSAGYSQMTVVQEAALPTCLEGKDALVKARTGTGKSAAFLIPTIETVLKAMNCITSQRIPPIVALILSPTRELAIQLAAEANVFLRYHNGIGVQTLTGGTRFKLDQKHLESNPCQIIVATPGRLLDHIENKSGLSVRMMGLRLLVLDEADHLLDLGFRKDIEKIVDCIPRQRQSLLFSATIPKEVRRISQLVLKREHVFIDTVGLRGLETPAKVSQCYLVAPHELHFHVAYHLLREHIMQEADYKVIVFCTTAMVTALLFSLLHNLKMNVKEMHSRKPQLYRTRISEEFRESKNLILVTSDVTARGMNYPDVTLVIQVGIPSDREQYIHRLGRTGREGKDGKGILLLAPWEQYFMDEIRDLPVEKYTLPELDRDMTRKVEEAIAKVDPSVREAAYHAWLGYYNSISDIGRDKTMLADLANRFSQSIGLEKPPALFRKTALKMGLKDIAGIHIRK